MTQRLKLTMFKFHHWTRVDFGLTFNPSPTAALQAPVAERPIALPPATLSGQSEPR
jgi:hypothetical protein